MPKRKSPQRKSPPETNTQSHEIITLTGTPQVERINRPTNRSLPRRPPISNKPRRLRIDKIMSDDDILGKIEDLAATGASLATINAALMYPPNTIETLLQKGRDKVSKKYYKFYMLFRSWAAEARHGAESSMAKKTPDKWLDRSSTAKLIESEEDRSLALSAPSGPSTSGASIETMMKALEALRKADISIDDAIDKGELRISYNTEEED